MPPIPEAVTAGLLDTPAIGDVYADCLQKALRRQTADVAPQPLRLYLGATGHAGT